MDLAFSLTVLLFTFMKRKMCVDMLLNKEMTINYLAMDIIRNF